MKNEILLVMPVPFQIVGGRLGFDDQTCAGLVRWAENFERVIMACPLIPEHIAANSETSITWQAIADLPCADRLELVPLPYTYKGPDFIKAYRATSKLLNVKIQECQYLCFALSGVIGDWGAIACLEALKLKRPYTVWIDRVEYEVIGRTLFTKESLEKISLKHLLKNILITYPLLKPYQRYLIRHSQLGLFQGQDCYSAYSPFCKNSYCVYDIHTQKSDQIDSSSLNLKVKSILQGEPLQICYVGRAAQMKGPFDWLRVIHRLCEAGVNLKATWVGDGPLLSEMKALADELGITEHIHLSGFVGDRSQILETMRKHHIFLFCHKTPESPRCLVESLVSGCPIIGYNSPYSEGLVYQFSGGAFVPINHWQNLADLIIELNSDREKLSKLVSQSALSGQEFDEQSVFQKRSNLIKENLI
ncbi:glycosyltransferase [Nodularia sp. NIES-3585]|uniref:glycosyltransferase n=1 Tax=Nodularia sp. NIES-3585 TaxID=1973477 RepID=UPI000B5C4190|nr:glycosyltransferase [Nodularia sp. NIES-3585]GAX37562.1 glycosyl transferase, group 1 family protein [Nodularia sp. NIES-3585]